METSPSLSLSRGVKEAALDWGAARDMANLHDRELLLLLRMPERLPGLFTRRNCSEGCWGLSAINSRALSTWRCFCALRSFRLINPLF